MNIKKFRNYLESRKEENHDWARGAGVVVRRIRQTIEKVTE